MLRHASSPDVVVKRGRQKRPRRDDPSFDNLLGDPYPVGGRQTIRDQTLLGGRRAVDVRIIHIKLSSFDPIAPNPDRVRTSSMRRFATKIGARTPECRLHLSAHKDEYTIPYFRYSR